MTGSFKTSVPVHYYEINNHREATPVAVLNYLEEAAIRHSESVGCGMDDILAKGWIWMLTRWTLQMKRYPKWNERISIETWPYKFERFYATREFRITGETGDLIGQATSLWVFFDTNRKRPSRIPAEICDSYGTSTQRMIEDSFDQLPDIDAGPEGLDFRVRLRDIDIYNHVNNTKYVEWLLETIPLDVHEQYCLEKIEVAYKREIYYGGVVTCYIDKLPEGTNGLKVFCHSICDKTTGEELVKARSYWNKRVICS